MTRRPTTTAAQKLKVLERQGAKVLCACGCGEWFSISDIQYDHFHPLALGGPHTVDNLGATGHHNTKTNGTPATTYGSDKHAIAKTKRLEKARKAKESGEAKAKKMKPKIQSRGFDKRFKKKLSGEVVEREPRA